MTFLEKSRSQADEEEREKDRLERGTSVCPSLGKVHDSLWQGH